MMPESSGALPTPAVHAPSHLRFARWNTHIALMRTRYRWILPKPVLNTAAMLLAEPGFGADQLFLTANALREARREAMLEDRATLAGELMMLITLLENEAAHRAGGTTWPAAA